MSTEQNQQAGPVTLVVGATGDLGGRVVRELLARDKQVRALVREGTDSSELASQGVEIARGDLLEPASLDQALTGVSAVITTATGTTGRRKGDSLASVDDLGNRNLVDAAGRATLERLVFTSILTADKARTVPQFWQKKVIEDNLEASGVPFVALRPGALVGGAHDFWKRDLRKCRLTAIGKADVRLTSVHIDDVARYLALAVDEPRAVGQRIDIGMERPLSFRDLSTEFSRLLGHEIKLRTIPWPLIGTGMRAAGLLSHKIRDFRALLAYFSTGAYVADTTLQAKLFGPVPTVEDSLRRYLEGAGLSS